MRAVVARRMREELPALRAIEHPDDEEVREALDVLQAHLEGGIELDDAVRLVLRTEPLRNGSGIVERGTHHRDGRHHDRFPGRHASTVSERAASASGSGPGPISLQWRTRCHAPCTLSLDMFSRPAEPSDGPAVLVVEDQDDFRQALQAHLEHEGYRTIGC